MRVVYHLPKKSSNFGWIVLNGNINFVSPNGNFLGKTGFLETKVDQNSQTENVHSISNLLVLASSRPFGLDRL